MAQFRSAYLQHTVVLDVAVIGSAALKRGDLVIFTAAADGKPDSIAKTSTLASATHMIALTDQTVGDGYVATDVKNYTVSDDVAVTAASLTTSSPTKKVGLYPLFDKSDIIL